eukprot:COSAG02_NODE_1162_length_14168_cov_10.478570_11_plen_37_part_00
MHVCAWVWLYSPVIEELVTLSSPAVIKQGGGARSPK